MAVVALAAVVSLSVRLTANRLGPNKVLMYASARAEFTFTASRPGGRIGLSASIPSRLGFEATAPLLIKELRATVPMRLPMSATMSKVTDIIGATMVLRFEAKARLNQGRDGQGVCNVIEAMLRLWGIASCARKAPPLAVADALDKLNQALQLMWNQAEERDYWTKEELDMSFAATVDAFSLPDSVQNVTGRVRFKSSRRPLTLVGALSDFELFGDLYLNGLTAGEPVAYHVDRGRQAGNDPARVVIRITPAPTATTELVVDVVKEAPRYGVNDITNCTRIPIPHKYIESILSPICRWLAMTSIYFTDQNMANAIMLESAEARKALGLADPLPGKSGDNYRRRKEPTP